MKRSLFGAVAFAAVALSVVLISSAAAKPPPASNNTCPTNTKGLATDNNVGATASTTGNTTTYTFDSFVNQNPVGGVPGLVNYCVYASKPSSTVTASAIGADGSKWTASKPGNDFSFTRPGGNSTNIPLDGKTGTPIGSATWATVPATQTIVLHISDSSKCGTSPTCFVLPGTKPGPVCNAASSADANAAYNNIPKDAVDCGPPSQAFEATSTKEFGDEVQLGKSGNLQSLTVLFNSYACEDFPAWFNGQCFTSNNADTYTHEITANIYAASTGTYPAAVVPGGLLATVTQTQTIPFRPSADPTCVDGSNNPTGAYRNPVTNQCTFSKKVLLTFTFPSGQQPAFAVGDHVVWTVSFATSSNGLPVSPADSAQCTVNAGCPYDSLNVGTKTFDNAPYAGAFVDDHGVFMDSSVGAFYCDNGAAGTGTLRASTNPPSPCTNPNNGLFPDGNYSPTAWLGWQPLGKIVLG